MLHKVCFFILIFTNLNLLAYDQSAVDDLNNGETNCRYKDFSSADLSNEEYDGVDFTGSILTNVNFSQTTLENINFTSVDLTGANFTGATINTCDFKAADLTNSTYSNLTIQYSNFTQALFVEADMQYSTFTTCTIQDMVLLNPTIEYSDKDFLIRHGAISSSCSYLLNSDTHVRTSAVREPNKQIHLDGKKNMLTLCSH